jgi:membrane fusion protein (multidrug efflux system)
MTTTLVRILVLGLLVVAAYLVAQRWDGWVGNVDRQATDDAYLQTDITPIGAKVSGYVLEAPVGDYATVHKGDLIAALVPDDYRALLAQQDASVAAASAALETNRAATELQQANIEAAQASVDAVSAVLSRNRLEAARQRRLANDGAGTEQAQEGADTNAAQSTAQLAQGHAQVAAAQRQLHVLAAQRAQAEAALAAAHANRDLAALNLGYTRIVAPSDGTTGQRQVRVGQFISPGQQVAVIAALPRIWVLANFKENQIRNMRPGQPCEIAIDAFPDQPLKGHVLGFAPGTGSQFALLPPDNATGNFTKVVQRIGVKIAVDDPGKLGDRLRPGLSVVATVSTRQ